MNRIHAFLLLIAIVVLLSVSVQALSLESNGSVHTVTQGAMEFKTNSNGLVDIQRNGKNLAELGFTLKGTVNAQQRFLNSWSTDWTWIVLSNTDSNVSLLGSTNWQGLEWVQRWDFTKTDQKFSHALTNNTGFNVTNTSFYYVTRFNSANVECLKYLNHQGQGREFCFEQDFSTTQDLEQYLKRIEFGKTYFNFQDLTDSGFQFNYLFAGQLNNAHPSLIGNGFIVGVTKNNGFFPNGSRIVLDPSIIDSG